MSVPELTKLSALAQAERAGLDPPGSKRSLKDLIDLFRMIPRYDRDFINPASVQGINLPLNQFLSVNRQEAFRDLSRKRQQAFSLPGT
jgi:hypothetical protein